MCFCPHCAQLPTEREQEMFFMQRKLSVNVMFYSQSLLFIILALLPYPQNIWIYFHKLKCSFMTVWAATEPLTLCWCSLLVQVHATKTARLRVYLYAALQDFDLHSGSRMRGEGGSDFHSRSWADRFVTPESKGHTEWQSGRWSSCSSSSVSMWGNSNMRHLTVDDF